MACSLAAQPPTAQPWQWQGAGQWVEHTIHADEQAKQMNMSAVAMEDRTVPSIMIMYIMTCNDHYQPASTTMVTLYVKLFSKFYKNHDKFNWLV